MKKLCKLLLAMTLCLSMTACGSEKKEEAKQDSEPANAEERIVTDVTGHEVKVPEKIERIIALSASDCEVIYALGAGDLMVGRGEFCNYPEEVENVTSLKSGSETNIEQIIALEPQVVFMSQMDQEPEQIKALEDAGIAVCLGYETDINGVYDYIGVMGEVLDRQDEAEKIVTEMKDTFTELQEKVKGKEGKSIYFEVSPLEYGLWTTGSGTFMNEIAEMLGLTNIFADVNGWAEVSEEQVIERNPDYIVTSTMYFNDGPTPEEEILGRTAWQDMTAIKEGNVYNANSDQISRPGPRLAEAAEMLYEFVYGEE